MSYLEEYIWAERQTHRRCEDEDTDWGEAKVMEHQKFLVNHYKLVEGNGIDSHSQVSEETNPTDKLILHF